LAVLTLGEDAYLRVYFKLLNNEQKAEVCDATKVARGTGAGLHLNPVFAR
jgi:hypothetical protein